ncbi:sensor histidine kinase [Amycolatopsis suaedae]|uniref:Oxygen sensor histidine kinase NreB n=1 Tax=Amycolatopsis suaedae TaxID=2510978 RepID=A0A4Q7J884_9PSEU|nr:sensor histidine kinase [Amycolatopsis suaedae]RZQ62294.1 sensor histidine kinase [Amycolatopsis suaedae]
MVGVSPSELGGTQVRRAAWTFTLVGLGVLACTTVAAVLAHALTHRDWAVTLGLVGVAAVWLLGMLEVFPRRQDWRLVTVYYAGLLLLGTALVVRDGTFIAFAAVGYPFAFALLRPRWSFFGVAATAVLPLLVIYGFEPEPAVPLWVLLLSVCAPLLHAGWLVGTESEKRRRANAELAASLRESAQLQAQLLRHARESGVAEERRRLAGEIHDSLAQGLSGVVAQLQAAERTGADTVAHRKHLTRAKTLARDSLTEARRSVLALCPEALDRGGLPDALSELGRTWSADSSVPVTVRVHGAPVPLATGTETALYRAAQEALHNIGKHARATRAGISLSYVDNVVLLDVHDDGAGFEPARCRVRGDGTGFGLRAMRRRVESLGGTLTVESEPGTGTTINLQLPLVRESEGGPA